MNKKPMILIVFSIADQRYAIDAESVGEILPVDIMSTEKHSNPIVKGSLFQGDKIIPVVDIRMLLGYISIRKSVDTCIITVKHDDEKSASTAALIVDSAEDVLEISNMLWDYRSEKTFLFRNELVKGSIQHNDSQINILDTVALFQILDTIRLQKNTAA